MVENNVGGIPPQEAEREKIPSHLGVQGRLLYYNTKFYNPFFTPKPENITHENFIDRKDRVKDLALENTGNYDSNSFWEHRAKADGIAEDLDAQKEIWFEESEVFLKTNWGLLPWYTKIS
jgi:hypothetical protein